MGKVTRISLSLCTVLFVVAVLWTPTLADDKCSLGCKGSASGASFLSGHKYNYGVEGSVSVYLTGADKQETSVRLLSQASVTALGGCVLELKVANSAISGPDGKKYPSPPGIEKPVRFTLQDGRLGADICAEPGDTRRSLNIKRAIISLLQTEQKPSTLVDVFGACPTEVSASQEGASLLVHQTRDLSRCAHREQGKNELMTAVYNPTAEIKDTQVLQSVLNIESKVNSGVPEKVAATEEYLYKPFSVGENGARAKVLTKLTLTGKAAGAATGAGCTERHSVIFENPHGVPKDSNAEAALNIVKEVAKTLATEASSKSAGLFAQLVRIFRSTNNDDLNKVFAQVKGNTLERRVFLDGLLRTGTGDSIETSINIAKSKELNPIEQQLVYISLGNAKHVNDDALKAATSLLDQPNLPKEIYLGVGALAGTYCREHNCHSGESQGIKVLSQKLVAKLNCKPKSKVEEDKVVAILKGIRSIHHLEDTLIDKLVHCGNDNAVKARVRTAALEAYLADPCAAKLKKSALDIMKNRQLDSEIRIRGYLAVIACPCGKSATEIKNLLENEPIHQVGRFITTSLRHLRASSSPDKAAAKQHYGQIRTPNKFNVDDRKYSFYREASFNVDALGLGGNIEETVIYSQDSFLPRSASLNVTAEVFGHSLNVFEIGGRQGNLDKVLEHLFGPRSELRTKDAQSIYDNIVKRWDDASKKVKDGLSRGRTSRSVQAEAKAIDDKIKSAATSFNNELDLDVYLKLFGTDAIFLSLGDDKGFDPNKAIDQLLKFANEGISKAKHLQQDLRAHLLFLDAELAYPTLTGFPLKLNLIGSATGRLDIATNVDFRQIISNPQSAKIDLKIIPSVDIDIIGAFTVDADALITGLKVDSNLHSSTGTHIIAKVLENGRGFDLQLGLPIEKQELVTFSNDLVFVTAEKGQKSKIVPLKVDTDRKEESFCFDQLKGFLGQTVCVEFSVPFSVSGPDAQASISKFVARYPLTGPAKIKLTLLKEDLRGYHIKGVLRNDNTGRKGFELLFEAEGSKNRRTQIEGEFVYNENEKTISLSLESPIKTVSGQVSLYTKPSEFVALVKGKMDAQEYYAKVGFNVQGNAQRSVFKPVAEYQIPGDKGKQALKIEGQLIKEVNGPVSKYSFEGIKVNLPSSNEIVDINGHYSQEPKGMEVDIKAKKGEHNLVLSGTYKGNDGKLLFTNTLNPNLNFKADGHFQFGGETIHNSLDLYYGGDLRNNQNRVSFNQMLKYRKEKDVINSLITKNKFEIYAIPLKLKLDADVDAKKIDVELEGLYVDRKIAFDLEARNQIKKQGDYSVKVIGTADKYGVEIFSKRDIVGADKSNLENYIDVKGFGKYELSGVVHHKRKPNDIHVGAVGQLKISAGDKKENINFDLGLVENNKLYSSHAKLSSSKGQILEYLVKITKGANANGQLKFVLKDTVSADGQFKVTDKDGRGNGMLIVDFKKSQRKIKADGKFVVKDPIFSADVDIYLNFEKDNNDKIHISTNTKNTEDLVDSKNKLIYGGKKTEVNFHKAGTFEPSGKTNTELEIVLPTERVLSLKVDRDITIKDETYNGHGSFILSDAAKRGGPASIISYKSKIIDTKLDADKIHYEGQIDLKLKDGKNLQNTFVIKNVPEGENAKIEFKTDVTGNLIPKPASLVGSMKYTNKDSIDGTENYRLKGTYGDDIGFELVGNGENKFLDKGEKKYLDDNTLTIRLPFEKAHDIKIVSNVLYLKPKNTDIIAEYTIVESLQINADVYKIDASGKLGLKDGFGKIKILVPHVDPIILDANYKANLGGDHKSGTIDLKAQYGKGKSCAVGIETTASAQDTNLKIKVNTPQSEKLKKLEVTVNTKKPSPDTYSANIIADMDGKVYKSDWLVVYSKAHPVFDVKSTCPNTGETSRIYLKGAHLSSSSGKLEIDIEKIYGYSVKAISEGNLQKDNVAFKLQADSEKLGWKNYKVDITSKDAGSGKRLEFQASNDNKNLLSGSTSFISKTEGQKTIIEGSGSVKVRDEQKSANFKYIRTLLTEGSEQGAETFLNLAIGERSYVAETRVTNLEFKNSYVYCEEKKQCAHAEVSSKINVPKSGTIQHVVNVGFDLRKLGVAPEFGLQIASEASEKSFPQHKLDLHVNKAENKYHLHAYSTPEQGSFPVGITITLPKRVLSFEGLVSYPQSKSLPFPLKGEVVLHMDKNKPQLKTAARFEVDVTKQDNAHRGVAEFGFSHPKLGKEAVLKISGNVALPTANSIKIETAAKVSHPTLGNDRETKIYFEANPVLFKLLINTPIVKVIDIEGKAILKDNLQQADLKFSLLQGKPVSAKVMAKDFEYYEFTTGYTDETERKLSIIGHLQPEKRVDITADIVLPGEKKNIIHGAVFLQDNLIKSDYGVSKDNFNYFISALRKDLSTLEDRIRTLGDKASHEFKSLLNKVQPTLKNLENAYGDELKKLYDEISNDQVLKELSHALSEIVQSLAKIIEDIIKVTKPLVDAVWNTVSETANKVKEMYEKEIEPQLKQLYSNVASLVQEYFSGLLDLLAHFSALVADFFEKHKPELKELTNTLTEIFKDVTRVVVVQLKELREKAAQIFSELTQQIKELPIVELIKEKWQELAVPEQVLALLQELHNTIKNVLPTEDVKNFADALFNYVQKKLRQEKIDDGKELRVVYEKLIVATTSIVQFIRAQLNQLGVTNIVGLSPMPLLGSVSPWSGSLGGGVSFSVINQLMAGDVLDPVALMNAYRPRDFQLEFELPPSFRAVVVGGQHLFSFDGRHLTLPGTCRYVLAHDHVDNNFTIYLSLENGQPKGIGAIDHLGTSIELKENGQLEVNGEVRPLPIFEKGSYSFKLPNGRNGIAVKNSAIIFCTEKLEGCFIRVNGFYMGKLRGLLGDANYEPYDDFRLPNGKITTSEAEFANAYKMSGSCAAAAPPAHTHAQLHGAALPAECEAVFGGSSPLRPLSLFLDVAPFRQACTHAVASGGGLKAACAIGGGYAALAVTGLLPAVLPPACLRCLDAGAPRALGELYELRVPQGQADVVVLVEETESNNDNYHKLLVPLVSQLVDDLKAKQITDIKLYLLGVSSRSPFLDYYDTDLKLKTPKMRLTDKSRYDFVKTIKTNNKYIDDAINTYAKIANELKVQLGDLNIVSAYGRVGGLPLRPTAVKHTISVVGEKCPNSLSFMIATLRALSLEVGVQSAESHALITGAEQPAARENVVGYTQDSLIGLGGKKTPNEPDAATSVFDDDACSQYVEAMNGLVIPARNFLKLGGAQQGEFIKTAAASIVSEMLEHKVALQCSCAYSDSFEAKSICVPKESKPASRRK